MTYRIGIGYDIHRFSEKKDDNCTITLGGLKILHNQEIIAHSDGDLVFHAITDAILGAIGEKDIGYHFPPSDPQWLNADSGDLINTVLHMMYKKNYEICNIDVNIICENPKINPIRDEIEESISQITNIDIDKINIKAKTNEQMDSVGKGDCIITQAIVMIRKV